MQVPSFLEVFMVVERTARHNEFYEKFNCRYLIGLMLCESLVGLALLPRPYIF